MGKKIVLIAGPKSHGPIGNGIHDYGWSVQLLKVMLENSNVKDKVRVEVHLDGWPRDSRKLEDADTIMIISDGRDGNLYAEAPHLASPERVRFMEKQMKRGCGFLTFHFSTFAPDQYGEQMLSWSGGYFDWETDGKRLWHSAIQTIEADVKLGSPDHAVLRGVKPFKMKEEFYYNIRFKPKNESLKPLWIVPSLPGREPDGRIVAWAREREDGGRGFGTTCGHFYDNWKHDSFRKMILNAIAWTAKVEMPAGGVESRFFTHDEIRKALGTDYGNDAPIRVLLFAGNDAHKWHNWEKTTPAMKQALELDKRIKVEVSNDIEDLGRKKLSDYQAILLNYANWHDPKALSDKSKNAFVDYLKSGGGLLVVHFANGAFHPSLPMAGASDWPEYRKIVRRVWNHTGKPASGHDPFGNFLVEPTKADHPTTAGVKSFEITDELYFQQDGNQPVEPLLTARSRVTKKDEPLAWAYEYEKARVFQTVLGHSEKTWEVFESREVLRRAAAWVSGREVRQFAPADDKPKSTERIVPGKFGNALNAAAGGVRGPCKVEYRTPPLTAECWVKLSNKSPYNIIIAVEEKSSPIHWELFTEAGSGKLAAYVPGAKPDHVRSDIDICDGKWHFITFIYEPTRLRLFIDGKQVALQKVTTQIFLGASGDFAIGRLVEGSLGCDGLIDDVRISSGVRETALPTEPLLANNTTVGLWHFDSLREQRFEDFSRVKNSVGLTMPKPAPVEGPNSPDRLDFEPADPRLKVRLIDRSPDEAYMAVKCDSEGRLFVGGREGVFVFERKPGGGFGPKQELYRFPADSIIMGLEYRGNDLYVLTSSALYRLPGARVERKNIKSERLLWGLPLDLHVSFHCLAWGPEGDLYLNHGDPLLNYGDFSRPDHWGHWTLYSGRDGLERRAYTGVGAVLRVSPDGSNPRVVATGLRGPVGLTFDKHWNLFTNDNDHESMPDRYGHGRLFHVVPGIDFGWPRGWAASLSPERSDLVEPMALLGRSVPVGLAYYDEPYLPAEYRENLIMARWERRAIVRYTYKKRGASFEAQEHPLLNGSGNARPTGVTVGPDGRIYATVHYLAGNVWSPKCVSDLIVIERADGKEEAKYEPYDATKASEEKLLGELSMPGWQRRLQALVELSRRIGTLPKVTTCGFGIERGLSDYDRQLIVRELVGLRKSRTEPEKIDQDELLRRLCTTEQGTQLWKVLIIGTRLTVPPDDFYPPPTLPIEYAHGNAAFKLQYADEKHPIDLRKLGRVGSFTTAELWNHRERTKEQEQLFEMLLKALKDPAEPVQTQAAYYLGLLRDPRSEPVLEKWRVERQTRHFRGMPAKSVTSVWTVGPFVDGPNGFAAAHSPEQGLIDLNASHEVDGAKRHWHVVKAEPSLRFALVPGRAGASSSYLHFHIHANVRHPGAIELSGVAAVKVWHRGRLLGEFRSIKGEAFFVPLDLQPGTNDLLIRVASTGSEKPAIAIRARHEIQITLPEKLDASLLAERLKSAGKEVDPAFFKIDWTKEASAGNVENGRKLFGTLNCARCHAIMAGESGGGAPSLADAKKRFTVPHVVEAILLPNKQVAEPFRATRFTLENGKEVIGLVVNETADSVEVLLPDTSRRTIAKKEVDERTRIDLSPMPAGLVRTPAELRDLLAYILSDRPQPP
jgi:putative heme-binding domain-containing protein